MLIDSQFEKAIENGILDEEGLLTLQKEIMRRKKRSELLALHTAPITQAGDGRWRTRAKLPDGSWKQIAKTDRRELEDALIDYYDTQANKTTYRSMYDDWISEKKEFGEVRPASITRYENDYKRFFGEGEEFAEMEISDITEGDLERFIKRKIREHGLTRKSYAGLRLLIIGVFKYAKRERKITLSISEFFGDLYLPDNLFTKQKQKTEAEEVFNEVEERKLLNYLVQNPSMVHLGLRLLFLSGLRVGELSALRWDCVDLKQLTLTIRATEVQYKGEYKRVIEVQDSPKTERGERLLVLPEEAREVLREIRRINPFGEWVFAYSNSNRIRSQAFCRALKRACEKVCITPRSTHKIRKTYATELIDGNAPEGFVIRQLGHTDINTTKKIYYKNRENLDKQREILHAALGK